MTKLSARRLPALALFALLASLLAVASPARAAVVPTPWPGSQSVATADLVATFGSDLSGVAFDPNSTDVLWAVENGVGTLFKLTRTGSDFVPAAGWPKTLAFPAGTGRPDAEGITFGPDAFVYLSSERNNDASGTSRLSVLRYDPAAGGSSINATIEWDLTSKLPATGANLGLEGVAWVPDTFFVSQGFVDPTTGLTYSPATYPLHGSGLFVVAVEGTGMLHAFALNSDGTSHLVASVSSGFGTLADVDYDPVLQRIRAVADDTQDGRTSLLKVTAGVLAVDAAFDRPTGMADLNNEGLAVSPTCASGSREVIWAEDGDTGGHSLRRGTLNCGDLALTAPVPTIAGTGKVDGLLTAKTGTWGPAPVALSFRWYANGTAISVGGTSSTYKPGAALKGRSITVKVTGSKPGYATTTTTSAPKLIIAGTFVGATPKISGTVKVGRTLTAVVGTWTPKPTTFSYSWRLDGKVLSGRTAKTLVVTSTMKGKRLTVVVTGKRTGYTTLSKTSAPTIKVVA